MATRVTPIVPFSSEQTGVVDPGGDTLAGASERTPPVDEQLHAARRGGDASMMRLSSFHSDDGERDRAQTPPRVGPDSLATAPPEPEPAASSPTKSDPEGRPVEHTAAADAAPARAAEAAPAPIIV